MLRSIEEQNKNSPSPSGPDLDPAAAKAARVRELNDLLRTKGRGGIAVLTNGIGALGLIGVNRVFAAVAAFTEFNPDNDPWGEHDCATLKVDGRSIIWKIDYFDRTRTAASPDPADPSVTVRVLTVMLADEY